MTADRIKRIVIIGGGLAEAMPKLYLSEAEKGAKRNVLPSLRDCFKIKIAELGDYSTVMGAAAWVREEHPDPGDEKG